MCLPVIALVAWAVGAVAALGTAAVRGGGAWPVFFPGLLVLLATPSPLTLGNHLAGP